MARKVFFSFHYADIMNANIVRQSSQFKPSAETGFYDRSLWEESKTKGDDALRRLIDSGLSNTGVSVFLVGKETGTRKWCLYELTQSLAQKKGVLGIYLPNEVTQGPTSWLTSKNVPVYTWDHAQFDRWVEEAARVAGR